MTAAIGSPEFREETRRILQDRNDAYHARRILRAKPNGATHKRLLRSASPRVMELVAILPDLLNRHCIAEAERIACERVPSTEQPQ